MPADPAKEEPRESPATLIVSALALLLGGCATDRAVTSATGFDFALIGDMPYDGRQEKEFDHLMKDIDAADLAFVVHNGISGGTARHGPRRAEACRLQRRNLRRSPCARPAFQASVRLRGGDNEWVDCHGQAAHLEPSSGWRNCGKCSSRAMRASASAA